MVQSTKIKRDNALLIRELEQRNHDFENNFTLFQVIFTSLETNKMISSTIELVSRSLEIDGCYMLVFDRGQGGLKSYYGFSESLANTLFDTLNRSPAVSAAIKQGKTIVFKQINNISDHFLVSLARNNYKSYACIPLTVAGEVIGIIGFATVKDCDFEFMESDFLKRIGDELAILACNCRIYEELLSSKTAKKLDNIRIGALADISHELRSPLTAIKGFASSLLQRDISFDEETRTSFIQAIDSEADRLKRLIDDLLIVSRIEAGVFQIKKEKHSVHEIIDAVRDRLYTVALKHNLRILTADELPFIMADSTRIGEVISNLVENAVKYSPEGTPILVKVTTTGSEVVTSVIDKGVGIPAEYHNRIFERFCRLPEGNSHRKGTGLGLYICHGIVQAHSGRIWVASEPGNGSTFSFSLPVYFEN